MPHKEFAFHTINMCCEVCMLVQYAYYTCMLGACVCLLYTVIQIFLCSALYAYSCTVLIFLYMYVLCYYAYLVMHGLHT